LRDILEALEANGFVIEKGCPGRAGYRKSQWVLSCWKLVGVLECVSREVGLSVAVDPKRLEFGARELVNLGFALFPSCVDDVVGAATAHGVVLDGLGCRWVGGLEGMGWGDGGV
jgi:hypothetical protein